LRKNSTSANSGMIVVEVGTILTTDNAQKHGSIQTDDVF